MIGPTRLPSGQIFTSPWSQSSQAAVMAWPSSCNASASKSRPSQQAVCDNWGSSPLAASETAADKSRNTTKMISVICTRTDVPNHRPRLIGDQLRGSLIMVIRGRLRSRLPKNVARRSWFLI